MWLHVLSCSHAFPVDGGLNTLIGDNCLFMVGSHIAHDCIIKSNVILANNATLAGHVEIDDNGKTVDILALSAGELARVNTSTLLAIRKLMSSISKSQINVLFLDEVTNVLDEQGKERLVELLLREENLNTYIVSHGWTHPLLAKIEVVKEEKVSRLELG